MASSSPHDAVNTLQSAEAQPVDASGINDAASIPDGIHAPSDKPITISDEFNPLDHHDRDTTENNTQYTTIFSPNETNASNEESAQSANPEINQVDTQENDSYEVGSVRSGGFDGSLGSDTDTSKIDVTGAGKDAIPRYSVKKPAGFKPVSVTKSFLAKAGTAILPLKIASDKAASPSSPAPGSATSLTRPRLVAKTLSSSRSAAPKALNSGSRKAGADGPDPNQVWNRNRVQMAPQATPKHMTDEELRQQYGIQLASRPMEGSDSNQAKWADLEDEDEDWAPESLEWSDGTKINLAQPEPASTVAPTEDPSKLNQEDQAAAEKAASTPKASLGPKATVLKLGGGMVNQPKPPTLTPGASAAPKIPGDKPTLVAKPSPAPPAKSPWAALPPVEKVSPVAPPIQQPVSRFPHREGYPRDSMAPHPQQPTREIAADDYSRFPVNGTPRELFNSSSGRYEPAPETRRMSIKKDGGFRAAGVLQRPGPNDSYTPAEPSPAFQTNRTSTDAWRRRRASSNVSADSGPFARRMSMNRPGPEAYGRRDSANENAIAPGYGPPYADRVSSPAISHGLSVTSQQSPHVDHIGPVPPSEHLIGNQGPGTPGTPMTGNLDEELAKQKKLMRERAEAAMKRRKEEEAREEADRRERLRLKLEALQPKKSELVEVPSPPVTNPNPEQPLEAQESVKAISPPKPPAPSMSGESQRYGLMTLHSANQVGTNVGADGKPSPLDHSARTSHHHSPDFGRPVQPSAGFDNKLPPKSSSQPPQPFDKEKPALPASNLTGQPSTYQASAWSQNGLPAHSAATGNVWGPPSSQKALGNGDFQQSITQIHLPPVSAQQYPQHLSTPQAQPRPIGTPRQAGQFQQQQQTPHQSGKDHPHQAHPLSGDHAPQHGYPRSQQQSVKDTSAPSNVQQSRPLGASAWQDFAKNAPAYDADRRAQQTQEAAALAAERERAGLPAHVAPVLRETWTQITRGEELGSRRAVATTQREYGGEAMPHPLSQAPHARSRYQDLFEQNERHIPDFIRPHGPLTPPPEEEDHPVFIGGTQRPKVRLPGSSTVDAAPKPMPIVRLPHADAYRMHPAVRALQQQSMRSPLSPLRHQPLVSNSAWQERFNSLLDQSSANQKRPIDVPGFSVSKEPLEHMLDRRTPVSLPPQEIGQQAFATKDVEDEIALLEDGRDFGSVPPVKLPIQAPVGAWNPARPYTDYKKITKAILPAWAISGAKAFSVANLEEGRISVIIFKFPGMVDAIRVSYTPSIHVRQQRSSFQGRGGKSRNFSGQHPGNHKSKDGPMTPGSTGPHISHTSGRGAHRGGASRKSSAHGWGGVQQRTGPTPAAAVH